MRTPPFSLVRPAWKSRLAVVFATVACGCLAVCPRWPAAGEEDQAAEAEAGVFLPTDRLKERQLEFARRLIKDERWSDAVTLLDEILSADRDFFFKPDAKAGTWRSVKVDAARLVQSLPAAGVEAYALQFRARADRMLREAVQEGDAPAIVAVARRWFHTPAGQKATMLAALDALDADQPLAAAAWLDRLAAVKPAAWEPTLSVMRAIAWLRAGDEAAAVAILEAARGSGAAVVRIGGQDVSLSFAPGGAAAWLATQAGPTAAARRAADEWTMHRGDPSRNATVAASRPLLVPRYRVPLTRHPEEARWLEARRKLAADQESPLLPASIPLAVDGTILVHSPMGLLAVDFPTGKRLWLKTGGAAAPVLEEAGTGENRGDEPGAEQRDRRLAPVFDDATSGTLASDGRLVFAVECDPDAVVNRDSPAGRIQVFGGEAAAGGWTGGNSLVAYDLEARGAVAWRLPVAAAAGSEKPTTAPWYLGPPLPVSDQLFVLVEEAGEVRMDVLEARSGRLVWTQPLAELDEDVKVEHADSRGRRVAGLSPALAEGVLVCPTGAGAVIAVDLATRTLLWAYNYATTPTEDVVTMPNGVRVLRAGGGRVVINGRDVFPGAGRAGSGRWIDSVPVVGGGRVLLTPAESDELHCLDLRSGAVAWKRPRKEGRVLAGVAGNRAIVIGRSDVEAVALDTGRPEWTAPVAATGRTVSGRPMLSGESLFVPVDTPEVVEIAVATGAIRGRSPGRGGAIPGNLVAYRGEVISQGVDSLDVFHQAAALEGRIETAAKAGAGAELTAWAVSWRGQLELDRGDVAAGLASLRSAAATAGDRMPPDMLAEAMVYAMERDAKVAATTWRDVVGQRSAPVLTARALRAAVDGLVAAGDLAQAWEAMRSLLDMSLANPASGGEAALIEDAADPRVSMTSQRWIRGRLARLVAAAPADLRRTIDREALDRVAAASAAKDASSVADLTALGDWFAGHPAAVVAARALIERLAEQAVVRGGGEPARSANLRRDFAILDLVRSGDPADREHAVALLAAERQRLGFAGAWDLGAAWPLGRVSTSRTGSGSAGEDMGFRGPRVMPLPVTMDEHALFPGLRLGFDLQQPGLLVSDGFGRRLGGPLSIDDGEQARVMPMGHTAATEAAVIGRVLVVRAGGITTAYELSPSRGAATGDGKHRRLWTHVADAGDVQPQAMGGWGRVINRRFPRQGTVELGLRIREAEHPALGEGTLTAAGLGLYGGGVPVLVGRTLQCRDPVSGAIQWERHRLDADATLFGDDEHLCVWPRVAGRKTFVLSTADGRLVRECELPAHDRVLLTHGRFLVAIDPDAGGTAARAETVHLSAVDPLQGDRIDLGRYSGRARAATAGVGGLAVLEPGGRLTVIDLAARRVAFSTSLPDMPASFEQVSVAAWQDRYLVTVARAETEAESKQAMQLGVVAPLPQLAVPGQPLTGSMWAVDRTSGELLWQVPATILRHCLHVHQPPELPIVLFARQVTPPRPGERPRLSILCLDKRTGHAVFADDKMAVRQQDMLFGCEVAGDPATHTITIAPVGGGLADITLEFTAAPIPPQPPHQAAEQRSVSGDFATELEYWFNRVFAWPSPF